jgi:hypothetical protein
MNHARSECAASCCCGEFLDAAVVKDNEICLVGAHELTYLFSVFNTRMQAYTILSNMPLIYSPRRWAAFFARLSANHYLSLAEMVLYPGNRFCQRAWLCTTVHVVNTIGKDCQGCQKLCTMELGSPQEDLTSLLLLPGWWHERMEC